MTGILIRRGDWDTHTHREDHMKSQEKEDYLQAKERGFKIKPTLC